jgi:hypothetical protein
LVNTNSNAKKWSIGQTTIVAFLVAVVILIFVILPAEYNLDPTGVGEKLGLTIFNENAEKKDTNQNSTEGTDSIVLTVPAGRGIEYKLSMKKFLKVSYQWETDQGDLYVDLHGEPLGDTTGYFESYAIATTSSMKGSFTAPFEGSHGWYWKNESEQDIKVQLIVKGEYVIEGLK